MPPVRIHGAGRKAQNPGKALFRILGYMKPYIFNIAAVMACILVSALVQAESAENIGTLVDDYIVPMIQAGSTDFGPLLLYLLRLGGIFCLGIAAAFLQQYLMVFVAQGTQKRIRDEMFTKMQRLPLRYFDTNTAGNIMSRYTSDIDTLRQMVSQSIPQCISSIVTIVVLLTNMLIKSWILTLVTLLTVAGITAVTVLVVGKAGKFFMGQQRSLGKVNGFVEEMITGQKVVKVFTHEQAAKEEFDKLNEELCHNAYTAGRLSNMMGPVNNNLGYVQYAILAVVGGILAITSGGNLLTLGKLMTFMQLSRNFNMPISQISNQINSVVMALAGAERIFELLDEPEEEDQGYVTLVNAKIAEDGTITECPERTCHCAWRHPHHADGTVTYT